MGKMGHIVVAAQSGEQFGYAQEEHDVLGAYGHQEIEVDQMIWEAL